MFKLRFLASLTLVACALASGNTAAAGADAEYMFNPDGVNSGEIIGKYVQATEQHSTPAETSVEVDINASIPKLKQDGRMHALRIMSRVGRISYRVLGFQGSNTVKNQVIARYLQAEQQSQSNPKFALTPANYKFKFKGVRVTNEGTRVYVFAVAPHSSAPGLYKGELWLDQASYLPVLEKGRLSKNPSIFFKKVDFERAFVIQNGEAVLQRINSVITTRVVGKVELNVSYSNYAESPYPESDAALPTGGNLSSR